MFVFFLSIFEKEINGFILAHFQAFYPPPPPSSSPSSHKDLVNRVGRTKFTVILEGPENAFLKVTFTVKVLCIFS